MMIRLNMEHLAFEKRINEIEKLSDYAAMAARIDKIYEELGAVVMDNVSTQGEEPKTELFIPPERPPYPNYPA